MQRVANQIATGDLGSFEESTDREAFARQSLHHYLDGRSWSAIHVSENFWAFSAWGCLTQAAAHQLTEISESILAKSSPYVSLFDVRFVSGIDPIAFRILGDFLLRNESDLNRLSRRHAVLRPEGVVGAATAGFNAVYPSPPQREVAVFAGWPSAVEWLSAVSLEGRPTADEWQQCMALCNRPAAGAAQWLMLVQQLLRRELPHCNLQRAARPLGLSTRSLQRRFAQAGTTFQAQVGIARIGEAQDRLRRGEGSLTRVALDVGFTCSQNFSRQFRKITGVTPTQWRRGLRSAALTAKAS